MTTTQIVPETPWGEASGAATGFGHSAGTGLSPSPGTSLQSQGLGGRSHVRDRWPRASTEIVSRSAEAAEPNPRGSPGVKPAEPSFRRFLQHQQATKVTMETASTSSTATAHHGTADPEKNEGRRLMWGRAWMFLKHSPHQCHSSAPAQETSAPKYISRAQQSPFRSQEGKLGTF